MTTTSTKGDQMTDTTLVAERTTGLPTDGSTTDRARTGGLTIRGLRKTLGGRDVVAGIDLDVAKGEPRLAARPVRVRQDDHAPDGGGVPARRRRRRDDGGP
ncbi:hypothetical protein [Curtobacterium sp. 24E2]